MTLYPDGSRQIQIKPVHWEYVDGATWDDRLQIRIWGLDCNSVSHLVKFSFPVFCFMELPNFVGRSFMRWSVESVRDVINALNFKLSDDERPEEFTRAHFTYNQKLYYYRCSTVFPMVMLIFKNKSSMDSCVRKLKYPLSVRGYGDIKCNVWEAEINPIVKMLTKCNITYSSWLNITATKDSESNKISTLEEEYTTRWQAISAVPDDVCKEWNVSPGVLSFDIETYCDVHEMFPDKWNPIHVAYMISCTYYRAGDKGTRHRYAIIMGVCNQIPEEQFPNVTLLQVSTEEELIRMMGAIIIYHDPDIVTGYNIFGFDYPYLGARMDRVNYKWPNISRLKKYDCYIHSNSWSSGGYGHNNINNLIMPGRISVDMLAVIKRDFGSTLSVFNLDTVSKYFLNKGKHDISAKEMFQIYELMLKGIACGEGTPEYQLGIDEMTRVMLYCIQDTELVIDIMEKINWWIASSVMSGIVFVTINDLSTRGQQIRCDAQLYNLSSNEGYVMDFRPCPDIPFTGGFVGPPTKGLHENILTLDFKSLYPTIIIGYNICYTTLVPEDMWNRVPDDECNTIEIECNQDFDPNDYSSDDEDDGDFVPKPTGRKGTYTFKFYKKKQGLLPKLVKHLCDERNATRQILKSEKDPLMRIILDKKQLALKVSANSFYGFLGVRKGPKRPLIEGAMSTTAWGRQLINKVNSYLVDKYQAVIIYGDTDSSMVSMPHQIKHPRECKYWGERVAKELTELFPPPIEMEFEDAMRMLSLKKKMYAGLYIGDDGEFVRNSDGSLKVKVKGILVARRDNCKWARDVYNKVLMDILTRKPLTDVARYLCEQSQLILSGKVPTKDLTIVRGLGKNYKSESYFMKVFGDELRRLGRPAQPGTRLSYLVVKREGEKLLGKRMVLPEMYTESQSTDKQDVIDYQYYLGNMIQNHIDRLVSGGYVDIIPRMNIRYRPTGRHGWTTLDTIVKLIIRMIDGGCDLKYLVEAIEQELNTKPRVILTVQQPPPPTLTVQQPPGGMTVRDKQYGTITSF